MFGYPVCGELCQRSNKKMQGSSPHGCNLPFEKENHLLNSNNVRRFCSGRFLPFYFIQENQANQLSSWRDPEVWRLLGLKYLALLPEPKPINIPKTDLPEAYVVTQIQCSLLPTQQWHVGRCRVTQALALALRSGSHHLFLAQWLWDVQLEAVWNSRARGISSIGDACLILHKIAMLAPPFFSLAIGNLPEENGTHWNCTICSVCIYIYIQISSKYIYIKFPLSIPVRSNKVRHASPGFPTRPTMRP